MFDEFGGVQQREKEKWDHEILQEKDCGGSREGWRNSGGKVGEAGKKISSRKEKSHSPKGRKEVGDDDERRRVEGMILFYADVCQFLS